MAKIAVESSAIPLRPGGETSVGPTRRRLARGSGWSASDVVCSAGPRDRSFEEQFSEACVAIVASGSFQYRSVAGRELMTPGSLLLGGAGQCFECGHDHGVGDRCLSFSFEPDYFERLVEEAEVPSPIIALSAHRVPPIRELSRVVARACALAAPQIPDGPQRGAASDRGWPEPCRLATKDQWEAIAIELASSAMVFARGRSLASNSPATEARVSRVVRMIERQLDLNLSLSVLAREARLSRFHFLRVFRQLTGLTPHQYILRSRLRRVATRLLIDGARVVDIALDLGFRDISNFNHAFQAEFGVSPTSYRKHLLL